MDENKDNDNWTIFETMIKKMFPPEAYKDFLVHARRNYFSKKVSEYRHKERSRTNRWRKN